VVRIYRRVCRRRYGSKRVYAYARLYVPLPTRFRELVEPFLNQELEIEVRVEAGRLLVEASPAAGVEPAHS